jgi:hypothetical protein
MDISPEVLIYLQKLKRYLDENHDTKNYFLKEMNEQSFFNYILNISEINLEKRGQPELTSEQFEMLRNNFTNNEQENKVYTYATNKIKFNLK